MRLVCWFALVVSAAPCFAQEVQYTLEFPNAVHHEAEIEARFEGAPRLLELRMSRSSPGRYATHEFVRNIYNVRVSDGAGRALPFTRPNVHQWNVTGHNGTVVVRYTLFADTADGTYASIDAARAVLNTPACLLWARGLQNRPAIVTVKPPANANWKVATQLQQISEMTFRAPHLQYLFDSPILAGNISVREWPYGPAKFRLALWHSGTEAEATALGRLLERVTAESEGVFGEFPVFDFGSYTFLVDIHPRSTGDAMEHRNSTMVSLREGIRAFKGVPYSIPHEFFHSWNVERIRPRSLEPFNFEDSNISEELWFAEGFTRYYTFVIARRAGLMSLEALCSNTVVPLNAVSLSPGRELYSAVEMSQYAPLSDRGAGGSTVTYVPDNLRNTYISYYAYGAALALGIDLSIRSEFPSKSADDWMQAMWAQFGRGQRDYAPIKPYTMQDLESTLASVTSKEFAARMFNEHIRGKKPMPYEELLAKAGLLLRQSRLGTASLQHNGFSFSEAGTVLSSGTARGTPLYQSGLDRGDRILSIDGKVFKTQQELNDWLKGKKPQDRVTAKVETITGRREVEVVLGAVETFEIVPFEQAQRDLSPQQMAFRDKWLTSKAKRPSPELHRYCPQCRRAHPFEFENCPYDGKALQLVQ